MSIISPIPSNAPPLPTQRCVPKKDDQGNDIVIDGRKQYHVYDITHHWPYHNADGSISHYTVRYTKEDGVKDVVPMTLQEINFKNKWVFKQIPGKRKPYNLHYIYKFPNAQILIVEGEKKADAAYNLISQHTDQIIVIAWQGGANNTHHTDWSPITGRKIILFPDNDLHTDKNTGELLPLEKQPGYKAMIDIAKYIGTSNKIQIVNPDQTKPDGWDIADAILNEKWDYAAVLGFIRSRLQKLPDNVVTPQPSPETSEPPPPPPADMVEEINNLTPFRCLGFCGEMRYYLPKSTLQIKPLSIGMHNNTAHLLSLAPLTYWERMYTGKNGPNWKMAVTSLLETGAKAGMFNAEKIRGRGGWLDAGRCVIHTGNQLIVDGVPTALESFNSEYIYGKANSIEVSTVEPLTNSEAIKFLELCKMLSLDRSIDPFLLAGWCVAAPICGAMPWRPHLWLTGESGLGKTWIMKNIVYKALGPWAGFVQANTSEAGIRQLLQIDAFPIMVDEMESEDIEATQRVKKIIELARQSSSETGAKIAKGGSDGSAVLYMVRSMFMFSSINTMLSKQSDLSRITVLSLRHKPGVSKEEAKAHFHNNIKPFAYNNITNEFCARLRARTFSLMNVISANWEIFSDVVTDVLGTQRAGDQIGALIAAAYSLTSNKIVTRETAKSWVESQDWQGEQFSIENSDSINCLSLIMQGMIHVEEKHHSLTVAELINIVSVTPRNSEFGAAEDKLPYEKALLRNGIKYKYSDGIEEIIISDSAEGVKRLLKYTSFANCWGRVLQRIPGTQPKKSERFVGLTTRATSIPYDLVFKG